MGKVLLSIKPEFAEKIFNGEKSFEFRKVVFKRLAIHTIVVYASWPVQRVIGEFEIDEILSLHPDELWRQTKKASGISQRFFQEYFSDKVIGHAIKVKATKRYSRPRHLHELIDGPPPQSFRYLPS